MPTAATSAPGGATPTDRPPGREAGGRVYPLHPFLFAGASVLALLNRNLTQASFTELIPTLAGALAFALAVYLLAVALRRRRDAAAAVIASVWVLGCLYYQEIFGRLDVWLGGGFPMLRTLPVALAGMALLSLLAARRPRGIVAAHTMLNGIALVMFATPAWHAAVYEWRHGAARDVYDPERAAAAMPEIAAGAPAADGERPPDIYHFVFDRFASEDVLSAEYGIEPGIGAFLEERGFYVAEASNSNYLKTAQSLASTFYMDYLDLFAGDPRLAGDDWHPVFEMLKDHRAARFLKARGYDYLQFGAWWVGTHTSDIADENHPRGVSEFTGHYLRRTIVRPLMYLLPDPTLRSRLDWDYGQCQRVPWQVEAIKSLGRRDRPVYVFAHFLLPHDPYVFAPDGRCVAHRAAQARGHRQGYIEQVAYASRVIEDLVTGLQAGDGPDPVILVQADEGPYPSRDYTIPWYYASGPELQVKTGILNAYYFPGGDYRALAPDITPVNSYRVLFNTYFGTDFPLLPDRIEAFADDYDVNDFRDVTAIVRGEVRVESRPPPF